MGPSSKTGQKESRLKFNVTYEKGGAAINETYDHLRLGNKKFKHLNIMFV